MSCSCGNNFGYRLASWKGKKTGIAGSITPDCFSSQLSDASFVHLPPPSLANDGDDHDDGGNGCLTATLKMKPTPERFLQTQEHLVLLGNIALGDMPEQPLCLQCVERIRRTVEFDTDRLEKECQMYSEFMKDDQRRQESTIRALRGYWTTREVDDDADDTEGNQDTLTPDALLRAYMDEIDEMTATCHSQKEEIKELIRLQQEQTLLARNLDQVEWEIEEHRNALELEARSFDNADEQARKELSETLAELDKLLSTQICLPAIVLNLEVDQQRGLRYPLINGLRLAYRPKGDLDKHEIQAAWSLAAQLLLACGTLLQYRSQYWKIVPLSSGAKLIHYDHGVSVSTAADCKDYTVYNLGHPKANKPQTLLAWNSLMHGVVSHSLGVLAKAYETGMMDPSSIPNLPFDMTPTIVGGIPLLQLNPSDDAGWSRAIHGMSGNLLWLSNCASRVVLAEVVWQTQG